MERSLRIMVQLGTDPDKEVRRPVEEAVSPYTLEPLYPDSTDRSLASWFSVLLPDSADAERLASHLRALDGVDAAYVEPMSAPPG
jgi:hypothetical protein